MQHHWHCSADILKKHVPIHGCMVVCSPYRFTYRTMVLVVLPETT